MQTQMYHIQPQDMSHAGEIIEQKKNFKCLAIVYHIIKKKKIKYKNYNLITFLLSSRYQLADTTPTLKFIFLD